MKLTRLRIVGFKSFVEPTDFVIEPGLTGVVGPNGCGKSNLVEALRWVMGESSYKSMRASGMDDVIFAGSATGRRATPRKCPSHRQRASAGARRIQRCDAVEVSRRIERDGLDLPRQRPRGARPRRATAVRRRSTGARSPSLVRQGQISEIIAAKPQARRRILEEAAGIAGLTPAVTRPSCGSRPPRTISFASTMCCGRSTPRSKPQEQARQAPRYRRLGRDPPPRGAAVRDRLCARRASRRRRPRRGAAGPQCGRGAQAAQAKPRRRRRSPRMRSRPCARRRPRRRRRCSGSMLPAKELDGEERRASRAPEPNSNIGSRTASDISREAA